MKMPRMVDMARSLEDEESMGVPFALGESVPKYPSGLQIMLCDAELEKLGMAENCEIGDLIHLFCMAEVTGINTEENENGEKCRVSLQIKFMSCENEQAEESEVERDEMPKKKLKGRGNKGRNLYY